MKIKPWTGYPVSPEDIRTDRQFIDAFGHWEAEEVARAIVRYCQREDNWKPFTEKEIEKFFGTRNSKGWLVKNLRAIIDNAIPRGLEELEKASYLERDEEDSGIYYVNERFIDRCHEVSPAEKKV